MGCCRSNAVLAVLDTALCLFVFFPLSVLHWRGTWDLLDYYVIPDDLFYSSWVTLIAGSGACFLMYLLQTQLSRCVSHGGSSSVLGPILTRLYMYLFSWAVLCYWRGAWNLMDLYLGSGLANSVFFYVLSLVLAAMFRSLRTIAGIPMQVQIDTDPELMTEPDTRFKIQPTDMGCFIVDICFSQFVLVTLAIFVWRGIWNVLDDTLFPDNLLLSDLTSLVLGYVIVILLFLLEYPASRVSSCLERRLPLAAKIVFEDLIMAVATWGVLMIWRGAWDLLHEYFLPDRLVGGWVSHALGVVGLLALQGFGNVGTNGIDVDGSYPGGAGIFQTRYLRFIFGKENKENKEEHEGTSEDKEHLLSEEGDEEEGNVESSTNVEHHRLEKMNLREFV